MATKTEFKFFDEISKVISGEIHINDFMNKFNKFYNKNPNTKVLWPTDLDEDPKNLLLKSMFDEKNIIYINPKGV